MLLLLLGLCVHGAHGSCIIIVTFISHGCFSFFCFNHKDVCVIGRHVSAARGVIDTRKRSEA